ncbi:MAG: carbohydrate ABC transporter permease [Chloroflexi bacterium]|nr:carbohydrate ABC transporter permease [Chloroflexota bacterium]
MCSFWPIYLLLILGTIIVIGPFVWMVSTSLKNLQDVYQIPPDLIPNPPLWRNYGIAWEAAAFSRYFLNSVVVAVVVTLGQVITGSLAAYAFARMRFSGRQALFYIILGTMMVPREILLVPNYVILKWLGWLNTYLALTVPFLASAFGIFVLRQYFMTIPQELDDAAKIDGCGSLRFFLSILLPLSKPALVVVAVFAFLANWNSYIWPLIVTRDDALRTIQVGLGAFREAQSFGSTTEWPLIMAASTTSLIPVLLIYAFGQRWFTQGYALSGIKG